MHAELVEFAELSRASGRGYARCFIIRSPGLAENVAGPLDVFHAPNAQGAAAGRAFKGEEREFVMKCLAIRPILRRLGSVLKRNPDRFLGRISGVIHVGANVGQERQLYEHFGLRVIWIEPIPEVFETLKENIKGFPNQRAIQSLVTDRDDEEYQFHIADNNGASSSILDFKQHKDIWPEVAFITTISLRSTTLASLFQRERIDPFEYQALVLDTQGSELLVLKGGVPLLGSFKYIKTEVSDFESYVGCCQLAEVNSFMTQHGYGEFSRNKFASRPGGGSYFDIIYRRKA